MILSVKTFFRIAIIHLQHWRIENMWFFTWNTYLHYLKRFCKYLNGASHFVSTNQKYMSIVIFFCFCFVFCFFVPCKISFYLASSKSSWLDFSKLRVFCLFLLCLKKNHHSRDVDLKFQLKGSSCLDVRNNFKYCSCLYLLFFYIVILVTITTGYKVTFSLISWKGNLFRCKICHGLWESELSYDTEISESLKIR